MRRTFFIALKYTNTNTSVCVCAFMFNHCRHFDSAQEGGGGISM